MRDLVPFAQFKNVKNTHATHHKYETEVRKSQIISESLYRIVKKAYRVSKAKYGDGGGRRDEITLHLTSLSMR